MVSIIGFIYESMNLAKKFMKNSNFSEGSILIIFE